MASMEIEDDLKLDEEDNDDDDTNAIDDLDEDLEDTSVEELETTLDAMIEESDSMNSTASSIQDIQEADLLKVLGTEVVTSKIDVIEEEVHNEEKINIEKEIQEKVSKSIKKVLNDSSIKEALKGMTINISITFEEDE